jgi:23S rRNA pseudouridine2605 synthase
LIKPADKFIYIMLHKPEGVVSTVKDPQNRPVVLDYVKNIQARLFPVGRLDYDTSGLILLTNDGGLAQRLSHPRYEIKKTYIARLRGIPGKKGIEQFKSGLNIDDDKLTAPADISIEKTSPTGCTVRITLREGRNRQVRKMCEAIGCPVLSLKRVSVGGLELGGLHKGEYRHLSKWELDLFIKNVYNGKEMAKTKQGT